VSEAAAQSVPDEKPLALGLLSLVPLLVMHELAANAGLGINLAQYLMTLPFSVLPRPQLALGIAIALLTLSCAVWLYRSDYALIPRWLTILKEALLAAVVMGPLLVALAWLLSIPGDLSHLRTGDVGTPSLELVALRMGGGAWEELLFRWLLYGLLYLALRRGCLALWNAPDGATLVAEIGALALSSAAFAAAHLAPVVERLTGFSGGEPFDAAIFSWRCLAGLSLGILFRWRGMGVAAWTHAFFNLALSIGAGVDVFL
jgi:hypothetical protein